MNHFCYDFKPFSGEFHLFQDITIHQKTENDLKQQIESCKNERRVMQKEFDDLRQRLTQIESDKRNIILQFETAKKDRILLLKKTEKVQNFIFFNFRSF